ncbi:hypothetical protein ACFQZE_14305 [Paenibacillus sp. GCM10027627]|uniref:hypothetical protein n=1 Tax=unclassified Paenibacillus TaxID=185978 RepID=UPI00363E4FF5
MRANVEMVMGCLTKATEEEKKKAQKLLRKYRELKLVVDDFVAHGDGQKRTPALADEDKLHSGSDGDKPYAITSVSAFRLAQNQRRMAVECELVCAAIERAVSIIGDEEGRQAISLRYLKGYSYSETLYSMRRGGKSSTIDRRIHDGMMSVARTLKVWGLLDWEVPGE